MILQIKKHNTINIGGRGDVISLAHVHILDIIKEFVLQDNKYLETE